MSEGELSGSEGAACPVGSMMLPILTSVASLLGCFYVVGTYWRVLALRQHPAGIMFGMSLYGAIYQFLFLLDQASTSVKCSDMGILVDFFLTGQETYMLIFAIDLLLALKNPFSASKGQMTKYHICGGLWSIVCAVISHFDTRYALFGFCWLSSSGDILSRPRSEVDNDDEASNGTLTAGVFFALYIVVVYCTSLIAIVRTWNTFMKGLPDTFRTRQRIQRHLKYYVGCYFGYWTLVLACYALFSLLPHSNTSEDGKKNLRCHVWHILTCLLLAKGMVHALIWTRTSNILKIIEQLREHGAIDLPAHEDSINWALRLEILTNTTKGICQSVDRAERQARASAEASSRSISASGASGSSLEEGIAIENSAAQDDYCDRKESYTQIEELILENRNDQRPRSEGVVFKDFAPHVFRRLREVAKVSSTSYRYSLQQTTKERVSEGKSGAFFYFTEDRKYVVKTLTNEELRFLLSILPKYYKFMKNHPDTFMTRFFGCHGLTMYGKTVFFVVMQSVFATSLQIHERFDLKGSWVGRLEGRKPTGTIATCKYCSAEYIVGGIHDQRCDVRRGEGNLRHQYDQVGKDLNWNRHMALPYSTARAVAIQLTIDSDFLCSINCIDYSLLVGIHHRSFNVSHYSSADSFEAPAFVHHDSCCSVSSQFRSTNRSGRSSSNGSSSDSYSFSTNSSFVRNRSSSGGNQPSRSGACYCSNTSRKPVHPFTRGGMSVDEVHGPGLYYLGLIDILQQWNFRKRVEHFVRVYLLFQDRHGVSVVNPRQYAERFQQRVIKELIYDAAAMPTRDHVEDISLTQLRLQNQRNAQLLESSRTLSTMLASVDGGSTFASPPPSIPVEHFSNIALSPNVGIPTRSPCTPPIASIVPSKDGKAVRSASAASMPRHRASCSWDSSSHSSGVGRLSGGFVMEIPCSTLPVVYPTALDAPHLRRSLAPLTPSPRTSSVFRRDSEYSKSSNQRSNSSAHASSSSEAASRQCSSGGSSNSSTANVVHLEEGVLRDPSSPHDYRIVCTPTFPDKSANATMSA
ncbi:phosphatidylinositol-4-phosphate 5 kinase-like protein [Phytophthora sojae]|uniref:Phosphatidylinositol-4-phosphate 5 kinase-like protein n=1 Tax=Phytophthora sojae (strain P6497) TaxID=1094619 RepID=G4YTA9_PHYSP|nr:phosphatidylinositol-4-phosphate 5 kinase-like protein [Phytophthora sojae]EGZ23031.1 phosphatidylinositol-4-phosphate 5 kinase-like protein [Phytophthora sojae]|eukprot:XP_009518319.1 phosphatidylinositol-4-phosphate 5 kinase-like protein [Phytophthora sojae]